MKHEKPVRLRDFVKFRGCYFSVVSYFNDPEVKCLLRYAPVEVVCETPENCIGKMDVRGEYVKLNHEQALKFFSDYERNGIFYLPASEVEVLKPEELTPQIIEKDSVVKRVYEFFSVPPSHKGVTGSRLIGLNRDDSDVDFVVYGDWWFRAREELIRGVKKGTLSQPGEDCWKKIYRKRKPAIDFDTFVLHEKRKFHRAFIGETYFDLLYARDYDRIYEFKEFSGIKVGVAELTGKLTDDSAVFDYPARYPLEDVKFDYVEMDEEEKVVDLEKILEVSSVEVLSFTHTYAGQAFLGERVKAYGALEVSSEVKLIVGTRRECEEFIISESLVNRNG